MVPSAMRMLYYPLYNATRSATHCKRYRVFVDNFTVFGLHLLHAKISSSDVTLPRQRLRHSYIHAASAKPLTMATMHQCLKEAAEEKADHVAFTFTEYNRKQTYSDVYNLVRHIILYK